MRKPTIKERKFAKAKVEDKPDIQAYREAGYALSTPVGDRVNAHKVAKREVVQKLIEDSLRARGLTPDWAVEQLAKVAEQDEEMGAKRLATMNILELHGWNKAEKPTMRLELKGSFYNEARKVIDVADNE